MAIQIQQMKIRLVESVGPLYERGKEIYEKLERREKIIVTAAVGFLSLFLIWSFVSAIFSNLSQYKIKFDDEIAYSKKIEVLTAQIAKSKARMDEYDRLLSRRGSSFSLSTFLEQQGKEKNVTINNVSQPKITELSDQVSEIAVDVQLAADTRLENLVNFMSAIENSQNLLKVSQLNIKPRFDNPQLLDVTMQIRTFELKNEETATP